MLGYISTSPVYNPLSLPINSRIAVDLAAISEPYDASSEDGEHHHLYSPTYQGLGSFLACHSLPRNDDLPPKETRLRPLLLQNSSVTRKTTA